MLPVPGGADGAVDQHGSLANDLVRAGYGRSEDLCNHRAQQVPSSADGGLADTEDCAGEGLGDVRTQYTHDQCTEPNKPSAKGRPRETNSPSRAACTRVTNSVSCSVRSPVIASYRNGSSALFSLFWSTTK